MIKLYEYEVIDIKTGERVGFLSSHEKDIKKVVNKLRSGYLVKRLKKSE